MQAKKLTDAELIKALNAQRDYDIFKTGADYHHAGQAAERIVELSQALAAMQAAQNDGLTVRLPCALGTTVFAIQKDYCSKRSQDKCNEYCDGWDAQCPDNNAGLILKPVAFTLSMLSQIGKTVFLDKAAAKVVIIKNKGDYLL